MNNMIIREANTQDVPSIVDFQINLAQETENVQLDRSLVSKGVETVVLDKTKGVYYVVENEGKVVGCCLATHEWSDWRNGSVIWIASVYVIESARGKGVYKMMYNHLKQIVETNPALFGIRLYVEKSNHPAQAVYTKLGMNGEHYDLFEWMK